MTVAILMTCFNRKDITLNCLSRLEKLAIECDIFLVDDQSTDGTGDQIKMLYPQINLIEGSGNDFWNRGMLKAWVEAAKNNYDFYILLNDDVVLYEYSFSELFDCSNLKFHKSLITGIIESKDKTSIYYGGYDFKKQMIHPNGKMNDVFLMNGNFVLVPKFVFDKVGFLDGIFHHDLGDNDYGLRAIKNKIEVVTTRIAVGSGLKNDFCRVRKWKSTLVKRFYILYSPIGNNPRINFIFRKRHFGLFNASLYYVHIHFINLLPDIFIKFLFGKRYID